MRGNIEGRYSTAWTEPVSRMDEYVGSLRAIWHAFQTGEALAFHGDHYRFTRLQPYFNPGPHKHPDITVYLGGVNSGMCVLAGRVADGLVTHPTAALPSVLARVHADVRHGERSAGRPAGQVSVLVSAQFVSGANRVSIDRNRESKRSALAHLYSTPAYRDALTELGLEGRADQLHALSKKQSWAAMSAVVDDDMLDAIAPTAGYEDLAALLRTRYGGHADGLVLTPPADPAEDPYFAAVIDELRSGGS